jgi:hypothetical protein
MSITRPISLVLAAILTGTLSAPAQQSGDSAPQIVRLSFVQGDVRVSRGARNEKATHTTWEKATTGLPLESGFSVVTGNGRAEIEFEDASTMYLAENSALTFNDLSAADGMPFTTLTLLTGSLSTNVHTTIPGEQYLIVTPAGHMTLSWPATSTERIDSYLDAMAVTNLFPVAHPTTLAGAQPAGVNLRTVVYHPGKPPETTLDSDSETFAQWDKWVATRVAERSTAMNAVMQQAGLTEPIPGLADMAAQGTFFDCAPYGKCWEPTAGWAAPQTAAPAASSPHASPKSALLPIVQWEDVDLFPCFPGAVSEIVAMDPLTHQRRVLFSNIDDSSYPYQWAVCHTGGWIRHRHHYVWVVGRHRHHHPPIRWVKAHGRTGFVPLHPKDRTGKPPLNLAHGLYAPDHKGSHTLELVAVDSTHPVKLLDTPPKDFRQPTLPTLARSDAPRLEAHATTPGRTGDILNATLHTGTIIFDHKSQSFQLASEAIRDGHTVSIVMPFGGRVDRTYDLPNPGSRELANSTFGATSNTRAGYGGQEFHSNSASNSSSHNSGSNSGGGGSSSHSSGGGSYSGGGSRGGGGGGSVPSTSSSSSGSSSSASSSSAGSRK